MNITPNINTNYNQISYMGKSRKLQRCLDEILMKNERSEADVLILKERIKDVVDTTFVKEKYLGEGTRGSVFQITRKYAAKIPLNKKINKQDLGDNLTFGKKIFAGLKNYFGAPIVALGYLQILKNVGIHTPAGVPANIAKRSNKTELNKYYEKRYLPKFADVPQVAYNELAQTISELNNIKVDGFKYCEFDAINPNNVVLRKGHFYLVDEIETDAERSFSNTTGKLLDVFINQADAKHLSPCTTSRIKNTRKIFKKVVLASSGADVPAANSRIDYKSWEKALERCGIKTTAQEVLRSLDDIDRKYSVAERKKQALIYLNKLFVSNPV